MLKRALTCTTLLLALSNTSLAEPNYIGPSSGEEISPQLHKDINESFNVKNRLKGAGLLNTEITSVEFEGTFYGNAYEEKGLEVEGPVITFETEISEKIKTEVRLAFDRLIKIEENKIEKPMDWNGFFRDAKIIIDINKDNTKGVSVPFVTVIGKQTLNTGTYNSEMPIRESSELNSLTRMRGTYAIQFQLGADFIKALDSVILTTFTTGQGQREYQGNDIQKNRFGSMVVISKKATENILLTGSLVHIDYDQKPENRFNWGIVYTTADKDLKIFFNQSLFNNNPIYKNSNTVWTFGVVKKISTKGKITAERTQVDNVKRQYSIGYIHELNDATAAGIEARRDQCINSNLCTNDTYWGGYIEYQWDKKD